MREKEDGRDPEAQRRSALDAPVHVRMVPAPTIANAVGFVACRPHFFIKIEPCMNGAVISVRMHISPSRWQKTKRSIDM